MKFLLKELTQVGRGASAKALIKVKYTTMRKLMDRKCSEILQAFRIFICHSIDRCFFQVTGYLHNDRQLLPILENNLYA
jgi:hypothetical protein